ncbi:hypothetical protein GW17_00024953 [Ensete ventricosum]|nr:hypothetical protein GW17_00024953 [Ensete ventricosum]
MCIIFTRVTHWGIRGGASNPADIKDDASVAIAGGDVGVLPNQRPNYSTVGEEDGKMRKCRGCSRSWEGRTSCPSLPSSALDDAIGSEDGSEGEGAVADTGAMEVEDESLKEKGAASGGTRRRRSSRWDVASWERKRMEASAGGWRHEPSHGWKPEGGGEATRRRRRYGVRPVERKSEGYEAGMLSLFPSFLPSFTPSLWHSLILFKFQIGRSISPESDGSGWSTVGLVEREVRSPKASRYRYYYLNGELLSLLGLMGWVMAPAVTVSSSMHGALDLSRLLRPWLIRAAAQPFFSLFSLNWCSTLTLMTLSCLGSKKRKEDSPIVLIIELKLGVIVAN